MSNEDGTSTALVPAGADLELAEGSLEAIIGRLVDQAKVDGIALTGQGGLLPALAAKVLETVLAGEMTEHLGYWRHAVQGHNTGNSRNESFPKMVTMVSGEPHTAEPVVAAQAHDLVLDLA